MNATLTRTTHLDAARSLLPLIAEHADAAELGRRLPEPLVDAFIDAPLFQMLVPADVGGDDITFPDNLRVLEELAKGDGSAAWNVMIGSGVGTYAAWLDPDTAFEVFGSQRTVCAAAFMANGVATKIDGGYTTRDAGRTAAAASRARGSTSVNRSRFSVGLSMNCSESMAAPTTITDRQIARYAKIA